MASRRLFATSMCCCPCPSLALTPPRPRSPISAFVARKSRLFLIDSQGCAVPAVPRLENLPEHRKGERGDRRETQQSHRTALQAPASPSATLPLREELLNHPGRNHLLLRSQPCPG